MGITPETVPLTNIEKESAEEAAIEQNHVRNTFNFYATNKTVAQGLLDLALLTTNATQLKHILLIGDLHPFYHLILYGVILSLILQIGLGILLLFIGSLDVDRLRVQRLNNYTAILIFVITILNVLVSIFNDEAISRKYRECMRRITLIEKTNKTFIW